MGITGTTLTPASTNTTCSPYAIASADRWDYGRCSVASGLTTSGTPISAPVLHQVQSGTCPTDSAYSNTAVASTFYQQWQYSYLTIALGAIQDLGYTQASSLATETQKLITETVMDTADFNPFDVAAYEMGVKDSSGGTVCDGNGKNKDPFITTYTRLKSSYVASVQSATTFDHGLGTPWENFSCADHGYSLLALVAGEYAKQHNISTTVAGCPSENCTGAAAALWLEGHVPYFGRAITGSTPCGTDQQAPFAIVARATSACVIATNSPVPGGATDTFYATTISTANCSAPVFAISAGALPSGFDLNSSSGAISGTCSTAGVYNFTVAVTDANGNASQPYSLTLGGQAATGTAIQGKVSITGKATLH